MTQKIHVNLWKDFFFHPRKTLEDVSIVMDRKIGLMNIIFYFLSLFIVHLIWWTKFPLEMNISGFTNLNPTTPNFFLLSVLILFVISLFRLLLYSLVIFLLIVGLNHRKTRIGDSHYLDVVMVVSWIFLPLTAYWLFSGGVLLFLPAKNIQVTSITDFTRYLNSPLSFFSFTFFQQMELTLAITSLPFILFSLYLLFLSYRVVYHFTTSPSILLTLLTWILATLFFA